MKLPRDISGQDLARALRTFGYEITRRRGSHMRLTTQQGGEHHVTIPDHSALRVGTAGAVLGEVAEHFGLAREEVVRRLFG